MAKYWRRGYSKAKFVPTIAASTTIDGEPAPGNPTAPELTAGTDLSTSIADMSGWQLTNSPIPTPNLGTKFTPTIPGENTVSDSSVTLYDDDTATTIRTALAIGTSGYIVLAPYGFVAAKRLCIFQTKSTGPNDEWSLGNEAARFMVGFAQVGQPNLNGVHP